jgi:hypothetical protein
MIALRQCPAIWIDVENDLAKAQNQEVTAPLTSKEAPLICPAARRPEALDTGIVFVARNFPAESR